MPCFWHDPRTIDRLGARHQAGSAMGRYSQLSGKRVEGVYRAGDIYLSVQGTLVSETEKAIFIEERFTHNGKEKTIRVDIPYEYLIRLVELPPENVTSEAQASLRTKPL